MQKPFEVIRQGESELIVGEHEDGRFWVRVRCKVCFELCPIAIGRSVAGVASQIRNKAMSEATGHWTLKYKRRIRSIHCTRGWVNGSYTTTILRDVCRRCNKKFGIFCRDKEISAGRNRSCPTDAAIVMSYWIQWLLQLSITPIKKELKRLKAQGGYETSQNR